MGDIAIRAEKLSKRYRMGSAAPYRRLSELLAALPAAALRTVTGSVDRDGSGTGGSDARYFWALKDVSFEVARGQVLGFIGPNGAGKSTLLKLLCQITEPTSGRAEVFSRVGSLLEVGTGFHPELSGRENVFLNGAILGMKRSRIRARFDDIVAFAQVERFVDMPVKFYSSGMHTRLAFAVAAHLDSDILIVDEVLAVGDLAFQRRCLDRMDHAARSGRTVLFVSHNMAAVSRLCDQAILLHEGRIADRGAVTDVIDSYVGHRKTLAQQPLQQRTDRTGDGAVRLCDAWFAPGADQDDARAGRNQLYTHRPATIHLAYEAADGQCVRDLHVSVTITDLGGTRLATCNTRFRGGHIAEAPARGVVRCTLERLPLTEGRYAVNVWCAVRGNAADGVDDAARFDVICTDADGAGTGFVPDPIKHGPVVVPHAWSVSGAA